MYRWAARLAEGLVPSAVSSTARSILLRIGKKAGSTPGLSRLSQIYRARPVADRPESLVARLRTPKAYSPVSIAFKQP